MSSIPPKDRVSLCRFSFSDHRQCRTPRSPHHPHFCYFHARQESQTHANSELAGDIAYFLSAEYVSANDLNAALARLFPAIIRGNIKPRMAKTLIYLAQVLSQTIPLAQQEYVNAFGGDYWRHTIRTTVNQNFKRDEPPSKPDEESPIPPPNNAAQPAVTNPPNLATQPKVTAAPKHLHPERSQVSLHPHPKTPHSSSPQPTPSTNRPPSTPTPLNATLPKNGGEAPTAAKHRSM